MTTGTNTSRAGSTNPQENRPLCSNHLWKRLTQDVCVAVFLGTAG